MNRAQRIAAGVTLVLTGALVYGLYRAVTLYVDFGIAAGELPAAVAAYRKEGLPFVAAEIAPPHLDAAHNAAPAIREAIKRMPPKAADVRLAQALKSPDKEADALLARSYGPPLAAIEKAADRPGVDFGRDWDRGTFVLFPQYATMKTLAKAASLRAVRAAARGDDAAALRDLGLARQLALWAGQEPSLISLLVRISAESIALDGAESCLAEVADQPARIAAYRRWIAESPPRPRYADALRGEAFLGIAITRNLGALGGIRAITSVSGEETETKIDPKRLLRDGLPDGRVAQSFMARHLQVWTEAYRSTDGFRQPPGEIGRKFDAIAARLEKRRGWSYVLERILFPVFGEAGNAITTLEARRAVRLALADALTVHTRTGTWPTAATGIDPFTGRPLIVRADAKRFRVYSVGRDGKDNGGRTRREAPKGGKKVTWDEVAAYPPVR